MVGVAGIPPAVKDPHDAGAPVQGVPFLLEHEETGPFPKVQACPAGIERTAGLMVEYHQGVESVEVVPGQAFASSGHYRIEPAAADKVCPQGY